MFISLIYIISGYTNNSREKFKVLLALFLYFSNFMSNFFTKSGIKILKKTIYYNIIIVYKEKWQENTYNIIELML